MSTISEGASNAYSDAGAIPPSMNAPISSVVSRPSASASAASKIRILAASTSSRDSAPSPLTSTRATMVRKSTHHPEADHARQLMGRPRHWATVSLGSGDRAPPPSAQLAVALDAMRRISAVARPCGGAALGAIQLRYGPGRGGPRLCRVVRQRLLAAPVLRDHDLTMAMPPAQPET